MTATRSRRLHRASLTGRQEPVRFAAPEYEASEWAECHDLNALGGLEMLEWQDAVMEPCLARTRHGRWAASVVGLSVPRQNGKSLGFLEPRMNYGMVILGESVIYTAQLQKTSTETFEDMASFFDQPRLRKRVKDIKTAIGREQIILKNGGRVKFLARTRNGGRGQHGDLLVFDEALELTEAAQASFLPAISASRNPQTIYASSPPDELCDGRVFRTLRENALSGKAPRTAWAEWSVEELGDVSDRARWYEANPSLGILIGEDTVEGELAQMPADKFAIERLGWWPPVNRAESAIDAARWDESATSPGGPLKPPADDAVSRLAVGVKFSPDGARACASVAARVDGDMRDRPLLHVELARDDMTFGGVQQMVDWLVDGKSRVALVAVDGKSGGANLCERLVAAGMPKKAVHLMTPSEAIASATMLADALGESRLTHHPDETLDASAKSATRRRIGNDGWGFGGDSCPIESAAAAVWAVVTTKRNPKRRQLIG